MHLTTLRSKGYVVKNGDEYRFLLFGEHAKRAEPLHEASVSPISDLADRTGERVLCLTQQNGLGTVIGVSDADRSLSLSTDIDVGIHTYLHCSASSKTMLAHFPEDRIDQVVADWGLSGSTEEINLYELDKEWRNTQTDERNQEIVETFSWYWNFHLPGIDLLELQSGTYGNTRDFEFDTETKDWEAYRGAYRGLKRGHVSSR